MAGSEQNGHWITHVQDKDFAALADGGRLQDQLHRFRDGHFDQTLGAQHIVADGFLHVALHEGHVLVGHRVEDDVGAVAVEDGFEAREVADVGDPVLLLLAPVLDTRHLLCSPAPPHPCSLAPPHSCSPAQDGGTVKSPI